MENLQSLKKHLLNLLEEKGAHADFESAFYDVSAKHHGTKVSGAPYTLWQLLEHIRLTQRDILEYTRNPHYKAMSWPDDYWPDSESPPTIKSWGASLKEIKQDHKAIIAILNDPKTDLFSQIPHGESGHTILRELLLVADHNSYHIGQFVLLRKMLGDWKS